MLNQCMCNHVSVACYSRLISVLKLRTAPLPGNDQDSGKDFSPLSLHCGVGTDSSVYTLQPELTTVIVHSVA